MGCSPWGRKGSDTTERLHFHFSLSCIGERNGNPLQCSCLENPREGEPGGLPSMGSHRVRHNQTTKHTHTHTHTHRVTDVGFPGGSTEKNPPATGNCLQFRRLGVQSLGQEDPLDGEMATHSSTIA